MVDTGVGILSQIDVKFHIPLVCDAGRGGASVLPYVVADEDDGSNCHFASSGVASCVFSRALHTDGCDAVSMSRIDGVHTCSADGASS